MAQSGRSRPGLKKSIVSLFRHIYIYIYGGDRWGNCPDRQMVYVARASIADRCSFLYADLVIHSYGSMYDNNSQACINRESYCRVRYLSRFCGGFDAFTSGVAVAPLARP